MTENAETAGRVPLARVISSDAFVRAGLSPHLRSIREWATEPAETWCAALAACPEPRWVLAIAGDLFRAGAVTRRDLVRCMGAALSSLAQARPLDERADERLRNACAKWLRGQEDEETLRDLRAACHHARWVGILRAAEQRIAYSILSEEDRYFLENLDFVVATLPLDREVDFAGHAAVKPVLCAAFAPVLAQALEAAPRCPRHLSLEASA